MDHNTRIPYLSSFHDRHGGAGGEAGRAPQGLDDISASELAQWNDDLIGRGIETLYAAMLGTWNGSSEFMG